MKKFILLTLMVSLYIPSFAYDAPSQHVNGIHELMLPGEDFELTECGRKHGPLYNKQITYGTYSECETECNGREGKHLISNARNKTCCWMKGYGPSELTLEEAVQNLNKKIDDLQDTVNYLQIKSRN